MSRYSGRQHRGAARLTREIKREQAEDRNAHTPDERRRAARRLVLTPQESTQLEEALA